MTNVLKVSANGVVWQKDLLNTEVDDIQGLLNNRKIVGIFPAMFYPVRTKAAADLFFPTTIHIARRVHNKIGKMFAFILSFACDVVTFPIRIVTWIPRAISNSKNPSPFLSFLKIEKASSKILASDLVTVDLLYETSMKELGFTSEEDKKVLSHLQKTVCLREVPGVLVNFDPFFG